jgi:hypothetical protein
VEVIDGASSSMGGLGRIECRPSSHRGRTAGRSAAARDCEQRSSSPATAAVVFSPRTSPRYRCQA